MLHADDLEQKGSLRVTVLRPDGPHENFEFLGRIFFSAAFLLENEELSLGLG